MTDSGRNFNPALTNINQKYSIKSFKRAISKFRARLRTNENLGKKGNLCNFNHTVSLDAVLHYSLLEDAMLLGNLHAAINLINYVDFQSFPRGTRNFSVSCFWTPTLGRAIHRFTSRPRGNMSSSFSFECVFMADTIRESSAVFMVNQHLFVVRASDHFNKLEYVQSSFTNTYLSRPQCQERNNLTMSQILDFQNNLQKGE